MRLKKKLITLSLAISLLSSILAPAFKGVMEIYADTVIPTKMFVYNGNALLYNSLWVPDSLDDADANIRSLLPDIVYGNNQPNLTARSRKDLIFDMLNRRSVKSEIDDSTFIKNKSVEVKSVINTKEIETLGRDILVFDDYFSSTDKHIAELEHNTSSYRAYTTGPYTIGLGTPLLPYVTEEGDNTQYLRVWSISDYFNSGDFYRYDKPLSFIQSDSSSTEYNFITVDKMNILSDIKSGKQLQGYGDNKKPNLRYVSDIDKINLDANMSRLTAIPMIYKALGEYEKFSFTFNVRMWYKERGYNNNSMIQDQRTRPIHALIPGYPHVYDFIQDGLSDGPYDQYDNKFLVFSTRNKAKAYIAKAFKDGIITPYKKSDYTGKDINQFFDSEFERMVRIAYSESLNYREFLTILRKLMTIYGEKELSDYEMKALLQIFGEELPLVQSETPGEDIALLSWFRARGIIEAKTDLNKPITLREVLTILMRVKDENARLDLKKIQPIVTLDNRLVKLGVFPKPIDMDTSLVKGSEVPVNVPLLGFDRNYTNKVVDMQRKALVDNTTIEKQADYFIQLDNYTKLIDENIRYKKDQGNLYSVTGEPVILVSGANKDNVFSGFKSRYNGTVKGKDDKDYYAFKADFFAVGRDNYKNPKSVENYRDPFGVDGTVNQSHYLVKTLQELDKANRKESYDVNFLVTKANQFIMDYDITGYTEYMLAIGEGNYEVYQEVIRKLRDQQGYKSLNMRDTPVLFINTEKDNTQPTALLLEQGGGFYRPLYINGEAEKPVIVSRREGDYVIPLVREYDENFITNDKVSILEYESRTSGFNPLHGILVASTSSLIPGLISFSPDITGLSGSQDAQKHFKVLKNVIAANVKSEIDLVIKEFSGNKNDFAQNTVLTSAKNVFNNIFGTNAINNSEINSYVREDLSITETNVRSIKSIINQLRNTNIGSEGQLKSKISGSRIKIVTNILLFMTELNKSGTFNSFKDVYTRAILETDERKAKDDYKKSIRNLEAIKGNSSFDSMYPNYFSRIRKDKHTEVEEALKFLYQGDTLPFNFPQRNVNTQSSNSTLTEPASSTQETIAEESVTKEEKPKEPDYSRNVVALASLTGNLLIPYKTLREMQLVSQTEEPKEYGGDILEIITSHGQIILNNSTKTIYAGNVIYRVRDLDELFVRSFNNDANEEDFYIDIRSILGFAGAKGYDIIYSEEAGQTSNVSIKKIVDAEESTPRIRSRVHTLGEPSIDAATGNSAGKVIGEHIEQDEYVFTKNIANKPSIILSAGDLSGSFVVVQAYDKRLGTVRNAVITASTDEEAVNDNQKVSDMLLNNTALPSSWKLQVKDIELKSTSSKEIKEGEIYMDPIYGFVMPLKVYDEDDYIESDQGVLYSKSAFAKSEAFSDSILKFAIEFTNNKFNTVLDFNTNKITKSGDSNNSYSINLHPEGLGYFLRPKELVISEISKIDESNIESSGSLLYSKMDTALSVDSTIIKYGTQKLYKGSERESGFRVKIGNDKFFNVISGNSTGDYYEYYKAFDLKNNKTIVKYTFIPDSLQEVKVSSEILEKQQKIEEEQLKNKNNKFLDVDKFKLENLVKSADELYHFFVVFTFFFLPLLVAGIAMLTVCIVVINEFYLGKMFNLKIIDLVYYSTFTRYNASNVDTVRVIFVAMVIFIFTTFLYGENILRLLSIWIYKLTTF